MAGWKQEDLRKIAGADDLHIAPFRDDGVTYGTPTWIWSVAIGDALYVRGYNGTESRWYKAALRQKAGRIIAAGITREVAFEPVIAIEALRAYRERTRKPNRAALTKFAQINRVQKVMRPYLEAVL